MLNDVFDMGARLKSLLPARWFADCTPVLDAVLSGIGTSITAVYGLLQQVQLQARILTATGPFLDFAAADFLGASLLRMPAESDVAFRGRIEVGLLQKKTTRGALISALTHLTGRAPMVFEPSLPSDTGAYSAGGIAYSEAGGWGSLICPFESFVTVFRPVEGGIAWLAGYGTAGVLVYGNLVMLSVGVTDAEIQACVSAQVPLGHLIWMRISA